MLAGPAPAPLRKRLSAKRSVRHAGKPARGQPPLSFAPRLRAPERSMHCRIALQGLANLIGTTNQTAYVSMCYVFGILTAFESPTDCGPYFSTSQEGWAFRKVA